MSKETKGFVKNNLKRVHHRLSHFNRVEILATEISQLLEGITDIKGDINGLDIGCGDMRLSELISTKVNKPINWNCIDIYDPPIGSEDEKWQKYKKMNGQVIPFQNNTFDFAMFCDVLHHDLANAKKLLAEAKRVSKYILIKDHFEYGFFSRTILRAMDWVGNYAYDVTIPKRYYSKILFNELVEQQGLEVKRIKVGINLYGSLPIIGRVLKPKWQFIALLE